MEPTKWKRETQRQTVRLSGQPRTLLATTSLQPRLVTAATVHGRDRLPGIQHSQVYVFFWECYSRSMLPVGLRGSAHKQGSEPCSLPGESGFRTKVSGSTGVAANYKEKNKRTWSMGFVFFASSFLFCLTEWGHLPPNVRWTRERVDSGFKELEQSRI